jgi:thiosulfate dehydrogenase
MSRPFLLGMLATVLVLGVAGFLMVTLGLMSVTAQTKPGPMERWASRTALKATIRRESAGLHDPLAENDANLAAGVKLYAANCVVCHGAADQKASLLAQGLYIKAPLLAKDGVEDDPEAETYWKVAHGIRFTAMPTFEKRLTDTQMWQLAQFLKHMDKLPPAVDADWKNVPSAAASPQP